MTEEMMAPSLEAAILSLLPLALTSPVQEVVDLISHHWAWKCKCKDEIRYQESQQGPPQTSAISDPNTTYTPVQRGLNALGSTAASFLVSDSPLASTSCLPTLQTTQISPPTCCDNNLLSLKPATEQEQELIAALEWSHQVVALQKEAMIRMQAQTILQSMYVKDIRGQLQGKEERMKKRAQTGRINMDGRAKVLMQDEVFKAVQKSQAAHDATKEASSKRKDANERYSEAMEVWKARWVKAVKNWGIEKECAKNDWRKPGWNKPKMPSMEKALPKPKVSDFAEESEEDEEDEDNKDKNCKTGNISDHSNCD
ncbi:hypothetical protein EI94DRAFT_1705808 [Lactarius quietus]|nr:hypothetical protein EI94DRAFT_1705808 [Lactarius quietus]